MVRKLLVGTDLKLDRTVCIALFTLSVFCGTVAQTASTNATGTSVTETDTNQTTPDVTTKPITTYMTTGETTGSVTLPEATTGITTSTAAETTSVGEATTVNDPVTSTATAGGSTTDDGEDTPSTTMVTMAGTSASGITTDDDSVTNNTLANSTTSGVTTSNVTNSPLMKCFTCVTNNTTSSCYGEQTGSQPNMTCNAGEKCWTSWYGKGETFFNLTRSCHSDSCSNMHEDESTYCQETPEVHQCTQCCGETMCNEHINDGGNNRGNGVSGCLTTLVLSAVTMMIVL